MRLNQRAPHCDMNWPCGVYIIIQLCAKREGVGKRWRSKINELKGGHRWITDAQIRALRLGHIRSNYLTNHPLVCISQKKTIAANWHLCKLAFGTCRSRTAFSSQLHLNTQNAKMRKKVKGCVIL